VSEGEATAICVKLCRHGLHVKAGGAVAGRRVFTALESFFFLYKNLRALWSLWKLLVALLLCSSSEIVSEKEVFLQVLMNKKRIA